MAMVELHYDENDARYLRTLIDWCQFGTVKRCLESPSSPIKQALIVDSFTALEKVAAVAWSGDFTQWKDLIVAGIVQYSCERIANDTCCRVIYMPPAYLVQLMDRPTAAMETR